MKKIEAKTLEEAYAKAAELFACSVTDLEYEIVQHPSSGFLGLGAKKAIIVAVCKAKPTTPIPAKERKQFPGTAPQPRAQPEKKEENASAPKPEPTPEKSIVRSERSEATILNGFFDEKEQPGSQDVPTPTQQPVAEQELGHTLETQLGALIRSTCFSIDTVEVDVIDGTAYIFIDGEDAALLIGKEGYRYNALSYLLYNWIHHEYGLYIKLEIAQFLASQQEMIRNYIQPVIAHVQQEGWGKTRPLDGILVQIALEQLREEFPNKYVTIKRTRQGERYILINEFNKRS